jgi:hypothetical protein
MTYILAWHYVVIILVIVVLALVTLRVPITHGLSRIFIRIYHLALVGAGWTLAMLLFLDMFENGGLFRPICFAAYSGLVAGWDSTIFESLFEGYRGWILSIITCK